MIPGENLTRWCLENPESRTTKCPKAYRPIALLSTLAKVLTAIVAEDIGRLAELHQLLPKTHFGGRPGRSNIDAIHYLVQRIKEAWRKGKVVSILFLDVEGAFPNAVTDRLVHNLTHFLCLAPVSPAIPLRFIEPRNVCALSPLSLPLFSQDTTGVVLLWLCSLFS